ncbi:MAG: hypothetical protein NTW87_16085 [Planctomycetota bacterium]|nr:hypothetical protein [Planctomycetota bacterium]
MANLTDFLGKLDRRAIYVTVLLALILPLVRHWALPPADMQSARKFYDAVEVLPTDDSGIVLIAVDWGPGTKAENEPQTEVLIEHLMRRRVHFALITTVTEAEVFLRELPDRVARRLNVENPREKWEYGKDWVNFGYRPGLTAMIQKIATAPDLRQTLGMDARGTPLTDVPCMRNIKNIRNIRMLAHFTGLTNMLDYWLQFFQTSDYRPPMVHGCTSITIPEAYIYLDSGQLMGLHEGIAGAAAHSWLLTKQYKDRAPDSAIVTNTALAVAHVVIIVLIVLGNLGMVLAMRKAASRPSGSPSEEGNA